MAKLPTIAIKLKKEETEPDGSECGLCGQNIFLKAYAIFMYINGNKAHKASNILCQSCGEVICIES